jgi:hypothetical protein
MSPELKRLKAKNRRAERKLMGEIADNPLLHHMMAAKGLQDAARDVLQYSDPDGELAAELSASLRYCDVVEEYFDAAIAADKRAA